MEEAIAVNKYIEALIARGESLENVCGELRSLGWHVESAKRILKHFKDGTTDSGNSGVPGPDLDKLPTAIVIDGQAMHVEMRMHSPQLCVLGNVLTQQECADLIEIARPQLTQSRVLLAGGNRALGARKIDILRWLLIENALVVSTGVVLGMMLAYSINLWLMRHYELSRLPATYLPLGAVVLMLLSQLAVLWPAIRATRVSPAVATHSI